VDGGESIVVWCGDQDSGGVKVRESGVVEGGATVRGRRRKEDRTVGEWRTLWAGGWVLSVSVVFVMLGGVWVSVWWWSYCLDEPLCAFVWVFAQVSQMQWLRVTRGAHGQARRSHHRFLSTQFYRAPIGGG
jgi:hypothetical protein